MSEPSADCLSKCVRAAVRAVSRAPESDAELLAAFVRSRDSAAFEQIVRRHGPLVHSTCRHILSDRSDADDACQATFVVLYRKAQSIRNGRTLGGWLFRVARRAAIEVKRANGRRRLHETRTTRDELVDGPDLSWREACAILHKELDSLPAKYRLPLIACYLEGKTQDEAARDLGWSADCVRGRIERGRVRLGRRLRLRGVTLSAGLLAAIVVTPDAPASVARVAAQAIASPSAAVSAIAQQIAGSTARVWSMVSVASLGVVLFAGAALLDAAMGGPEPKQPTPPAKEPTAERPTPQLDAFGDPLPDGAVARIGSSRFRTDRFLADFAFSPDGKLIAGASAGRRLTVWEVATGRDVATVQVAEGPFGRIQFTEDGKYIVAGLRKEPEGLELRCYEARTGREVFKVGDGNFKLDWGGKRRALDHQWKIGSNDTVWAHGTGSAGVWELRGFELPGGREIVRARVPDGAILIDWTPDGTRLFLRTNERLALHNVKAGKTTWEFDSGGQKDFAFAMTPDCKRVVTRAANKLRVHDADALKLVSEMELTDVSRGGKDLEISPDGRFCVLRAVESSANGFVVVDLERKQVCLDGKSFKLWQWLVSPDGRYFVGNDENCNTLVWDLSKKDPGQPRAGLRRCPFLRFSPDGTVLAVDKSGCVVLWDVKTWKTLPQSAFPGSYSHSLRFTRDGKGLVALTMDGCRVWDDWSKPGSRLIFEPADDRRSSDSMLSEDAQVSVEIVDVARVDPKAPAIVDVRITDRRTGLTRTHSANRWPISHVVLSGDGKRLFTWTWLREKEVGEVRGWDTATGNSIPTLPVTEAKERATVAVSHDGRWLALFSEPATSVSTNGIRLWDVERNREIGRIKGVSGSGNGSDQEAEFSRDGRRLAAVIFTPDEKTGAAVRLWEWRTSKELMSVVVADFISVVALSPDGRSCAIGESDGRLRVFEIASGGERAVFRHGAGIGSVAFHPDGTKLAASSSEAPIYVWDLLGDPGRWDTAKADVLWRDLASTDAKVAFAAVRKLRANPAEAIAFMRERATSLATPTDEQVANWLKQLDAPVFADRERAQKELDGVAELIRPRLEAARKEAPAEAVRRIDQLLKSVSRMTPDRLRQVRACEVLEGIRSPEAIRLLRDWAAGKPGTWLTMEAKESLERLRP
jgi:RNA polymerase sigma factor (sigma-70 family)